MISKEFSLPLFIPVIVVFSSPVFSDLCEVNLDKGAKRDQLNRSLECLNSKIGALSKKIELFKKSTIQPGTIAAFDLDQCPEGWSAFKLAEGRVIVGAGNNDGKNKDQNGETLSDKNLRTDGGEEEHKLLVNELPGHSHETEVETWRDSLGNGSPGTSVLVDNLNLSGTGAGTSTLKVDSPNQKANPHNNMQPYIVLTICSRNRT